MPIKEGFAAGLFYDDINRSRKERGEKKWPPSIISLPDCLFVSNKTGLGTRCWWLPTQCSFERLTRVLLNGIPYTHTGWQCFSEKLFFPPATKYSPVIVFMWIGKTGTTHKDQGNRRQQLLSVSGSASHAVVKWQVVHPNSTQTLLSYSSLTVKSTHCHILVLPSGIQFCCDCRILDWEMKIEFPHQNHDFARQF